MVLLRVLRKTKAREKEMRILMLGLDAAGKTTFVKQLMGEPTDTIAPTVGFQISTLLAGGFKLSIWDVGGQKSIRAFWRHYFECTDALVWVVDAADQQRLQICKRELRNLLNEERLAGAPVLILANKQDLPSALSPKEIREVLSLEHLCVNRHFAVFGCSARNGDDIANAMQWLIEDVANRVFVKV